MDMNSSSTSLVTAPVAAVFLQNGYDVFPTLQGIVNLNFLTVNCSEQQSFLEEDTEMGTHEHGHGEKPDGEGQSPETCLLPEFAGWNGALAQCM